MAVPPKRKALLSMASGLILLIGLLIVLMAVLAPYSPLATSSDVSQLVRQNARSEQHLVCVTPALVAAGAALVVAGVGLALARRRANKSKAGVAFLVGYCMVANVGLALSGSDWIQSALWRGWTGLAAASEVAAFVVSAVLASATSGEAGPRARGVWPLVAWCCILLGVTVAAPLAAYRMAPDSSLSDIGEIWLLGGLGGLLWGFWTSGRVTIDMLR